MKLLVISLAGIGDTLFATPLIHELRLNFPDATIDALVLWNGSRDLLEGNPHLNAIHQKNLIQAGTNESLKWLWNFGRKNNYDVSINTHPQSRIQYRAVARVINARLRLSHDYDNKTLLDEFLVNRAIPQDYQQHAVENNLAFLNCLGAKPKLARHEYEIFPSTADIAWADDWLAAEKIEGRRLLGIHVGSGGTKNLALRRWPLDRYAELIQRLAKIRPELTVLLFGGPSEERDHEKLLAQAGSERVFFPRTKTMRQAAVLIQKCGVFLSVDTVFMHLAAAMKVPKQVVIETPTWNKPIEPYNQQFSLVNNPAVAGRNLEYYRYDGKGIKGTEREILRCMESVTVEAVEAEVNKALT